jgi:hypothetical protein
VLYSVASDELLGGATIVSTSGDCTCATSDSVASLFGINDSDDASKSSNARSITLRDNDDCEPSSLPVPSCAYLYNTIINSRLDDFTFILVYLFG